MSRKVLSLSNDVALLITRNNALATAGFIVKSPRDVTQAPTLLASDDFFAVLVGNSIPPAVRQFVIHAMRHSNPSVPILFVTVIRGELEPAADQSIDLSQDIGPLIHALEALDASADGTAPR